MISFSIDKQRGKVNVEWMSRPVDSLKNKTNNQPLVLALTSTEQSPTFASRLKRKFLSGPILGGAYNQIRLFISFIVEPNGDITGFRTINKIKSSTLDKELLRLIRKYKWDPGICKGVKVPTRLTLKVVS